MMLIPLSTFVQRRREIGRLRTAASTLNGASWSKSVVHLHAVESKLRNWSRQAVKALDRISEEIEANRKGHLSSADGICNAVDRLIADRTHWLSVDSTHHEGMCAIEERIAYARTGAAALHPFLKKNIEAKLRAARDHLSEARRAKEMQDARRRIALAGDLGRDACARADFALAVERDVSELPAFLERCAQRGEPASQAWRQYAVEIEEAVENARRFSESGRYEAARSFLDQVRELDAKIERERQSQRRRAISEIEEWLVRRELTPSVTEPFGTALSELSKRAERPEFLDEWRTLQARISEDVRRRYGIALQERQADIKKMYRLKQKPLRTIQLTSHPGAPILDWRELEGYARTMVRKCS